MRSMREPDSGRSSVITELQAYYRAASFVGGRPQLLDRRIFLETGIYVACPLAGTVRRSVAATALIAAAQA